MTKEEIIEGNKLIAEFMGGIYDSDVNEYWFYLNPPNWTSKFAPTTYELKYHSSWDWLIPCIEKIELIKDDYNGRFIAYISSNNCTIQSTNFRLDKISVETSYYFNSLYGNSKIEAVWVTIIEFIKWYNSCKKDLY